MDYFGMIEEKHLKRGKTMNQTTKSYWENYWKQRGEKAPEAVTAWAFGVDADELAQLVMDGVKTATCSGLIFYEKENEPLPRVDDYSVILNSQEEPVAIIKTVDVQVMPMNEVPEEFARAEGEGDRSYRHWWQVHEIFFTQALQEIGLSFYENMMLVCERFECIDVKK